LLLWLTVKDSLRRKTKKNNKGVNPLITSKKTKAKNLNKKAKNYLRKEKRFPQGEYPFIIPPEKRKTKDKNLKIQEY